MASVCDFPGVGKACEIPGDVVGGAVGAASDGVVSQMAETFAGAATSLLETSTSFWLRVDTPAVDSPGGLAAFLQDRTAYLTGAAAVAGVLIGGARMALARRQDPGVQVLRGLVLIALLSSGGAFLVSQLALASDAWSVWLFEQAAGDDVNASIGLIALASNRLQPGLLLVVALFALLTGIVQVALMVSRAALIPVLVGVLPTMAAMSMAGKGGGQSVQRVVAWLGAFLLYKPVAAVIYAAAFRLSDGSDAEAGPLTAISGLALLVLAILALPALMRVVAPAVAVLGGAGTGSMASGVAGTVATGAVILMTGGAGAAASGSAGAGSAGAAGAAGGGTGAGGAVAAQSAGTTASTGSTTSGSAASGASSAGASEGGSGGASARGADRRPGSGGVIAGGDSERRRDEPGGSGPGRPEFA
jgi:type IV secretion system protein TrbL